MHYADPVGRLAEELESWLKFHFQEVLGQLANFQTVAHKDELRKLRARNGVACSKCRTVMLPRLGQVGLNLDEEARAVAKK